MKSIFEYTQGLFDYIGPIPVLIIIFLTGLFVVWREMQITHKDKNSVFDIYTISAILMVIWGRFTYMISNRWEFEGIPWSFSPYERYSDGVYLFRLFPWRIGNIWVDGRLEVEVFPMLLAFILVSTVLVLFYKKWRWRDGYGALLNGATASFGLTMVALGVYTSQMSMFTYGFILLLVIFIVETVQGFSYYINRTKRVIRDRNYYFITFISSTIVVALTTIFLLKLGLEGSDSIHIYVYIGFSIISLLAYLIDMRRNVVVIEEVRVKLPTITPNIPVRIRRRSE